jgi:hypothetical protein
MEDAIVVNFPKFAKIPKRDPISHQPIPEPEPVGGVDRSNWEYISIPETDIFDKPFQGCGLNGYKFERGKRYFVAPEVAAEINRLLQVSQKADLRILQSHPDVRAVNDQQRGGQQAGGSTFVRSF